MKVSVVVCTLDREKALRDCINSLKNQSRKPDEIVIVSNKRLSIPGTRVIIQKRGGLANARNLSLKEVKGDIVVFFDDDTIMDKNYIKNILEIYDRYDNVGGVTGKIENIVEDNIKKGVLGKIMRVYARIFCFSGFFVTTSGVGKVLSTGFTCANFEYVDEIMEVQCLSGCNMSYPKRILEDIGKFDEDLIGNNYYEDVDYSYRVYKKGYKLYATPNARLKHLVTLTSRESLSKLKYFQLLNQKIFFRKRVYKGGFFQLIRYYLAHLSLFLPVLGYSIYLKNFSLLKSYIKAEIVL
jgi:GT2 family glycosyltransferase